MAKTSGARFVLLAVCGSALIGCGGGGGGGGGGAGGSIGGASAGRGGASAGSGGGAGAAGTGGSTGTGGTAGSVSSTAVSDAIAVCAWTTGCFNTEDSFAGGAPNTTLSACLASWTSHNLYPWTEAKNCIAANPGSCAGFRQCMLDRSLACPGSGSTEWVKPARCADAWTCSTCTATCNNNDPPACADSTHTLVCASGIPQNVACADLGAGGASCATLNGAVGCVASAGTCSGANSSTCEGTVQVQCVSGVSVRRDCADSGMPCVTMTAGGGCALGAECTYDRGMCSGNIYQGCLSNYNLDVDCAALGGTCGINHAGRPGCVFPEGSGGSGGAGGRGGAGGTGGIGGSGSGGRGGAGGSGGTTGAGGTAGAGGTTGAGGGGTTGAGGGGTTGTGGSAGTTGTGGAGGTPTCAGTLVATAPAVPENRVAQDFSTSPATGGTIVEGTYYLTSLSLYTGAGGPTGTTGTNRSQTTRITGSTVETVIISGPSSGGGTTTRLTFSANPVGSALMLTQTCPAGGGSPTLAYTATATTLTVYSPSNGTNLPEVQVFTLANPLCVNPFPSSAPAVPLNRIADTLPVANATGGTIVPGTYHLTTLSQYTGPGGATGPNGSRSQTVRLTAASGGTFTLEASIAAAMGGTGQWLVLSAMPSGTSLALTQICPTAGSFGSLPYGATATSFTIYNPSNNTIEAYTKQ